MVAVSNSSLLASLLSLWSLCFACAAPRRARLALICFALFVFLSTALLVLATHGLHSGNGGAEGGVDADTHQRAGVSGILRRTIAAVSQMFAATDVQAGTVPKRKEHLRCEKARIRLERGTQRFTALLFLLIHKLGLR